jgi:hypothetical protein
MSKKQKTETAVAIVPAKPVKVPVLKTGDDAEVATNFKTLFEGAQNGLRAVVAFGIYAEEVKLTKLKHGQFKDWLAGTLPDISYRSVASYMQLASSVLEACGVKSLKGFFKSAACCTFEHSGLLLTAPEKECNEKAVEIRAKVFSLIDGKSARQMFAEFKQAEEDEDGNVKSKRGRLKGQGGASAAQRAKAKALTEAAEIEALELKAEEVVAWIDENCDDKHFGQMSDTWREKLLERGELLVSYLKKFKKEGK